VSDPAQRQPLLWLLLGVVGLAIAAASWGVTGVQGFFVCFDNNECAHSHIAAELRGRLFDNEGRPAPQTMLAFRADVYGRDFEGSLTTDDEGRFCVRAFTGKTSAFIGQTRRSRDQLVVRSSAPIDPRFRDPAVLESLRRQGSSSRPFMLAEPGSFFFPIGADEVTTLWNPSADVAASCQDLDGSPPWYRFADYDRSWQFAALALAPLVTLGLFVIGVGARLSAWRRRSPTRARTAERAFQATLVASLLTALLTVSLWSLL
jgi:hypothetical protein